MYSDRRPSGGEITMSLCLQNVEPIGTSLRPVHAPCVRQRRFGEIVAAKMLFGLEPSGEQS